MKKHSLLKAISILLLIVVIASYFLVGRNDTMAYVGLGDVGLNAIQSFYYFFDTGLFVLVVGGFYGVLNKTGGYKKLLDNIVTKVKSHSKGFIYAMIIVFALISSLTGMTIPLFVFIPFVISVILLLGYDKLVAMSATFGASLIGFIGGIFTTVKDPDSYYSVSYTTFDQIAGADKFANWIPNLIILLLGIVLLILFVKRHIKNVTDKKVKYDLSDNSELLITEVKGKYKSIATWPLIIMFVLILLLLILGLVPWEGLFNIKVFSDFHAWLTGLKIGDFAVFNSIISANFVAFGNWSSMGAFSMTMIILLIFTALIKFIYRIKYDDVIDGFMEGVKKMIPTAAIAILAYAVLVCTYNNGFMEALAKTITDTVGGFNIAVDALFSFVGSILHVDSYYAVAGVFKPLTEAITDDGVQNVLGLIFSGMQGLAMLVGPTSVMLIIGLRYLDIPYTTWLKYIWRLFLELLIVVFIAIIIVALL